jgi:hypothetical protein
LRPCGSRHPLGTYWLTIRPPGRRDPRGPASTCLQTASTCLRPASTSLRTAITRLQTTSPPVRASTLTRASERPAREPPADQVREPPAGQVRGRSERAYIVRDSGTASASLQTASTRLSAFMLARACERSVHDPPDHPYVSLRPAKFVSLRPVTSSSLWPHPRGLSTSSSLSYGPRHPCGPTVLVIPVAYEHRHPCDPADIVIL